MDGNKDELNFRCCFYNTKVGSSKVDPTNINILINFDKKEESQYNQDFFCHVNCFQKKLHDAIKMHFHLHNILGN